MNLEEISAVYSVPAKEGARVLYEGVPAEVEGSACSRLLVRLLTDTMVGQAGNTRVAHPRNDLVFLDGNECTNCEEPLQPAFDFGYAKSSGWLHATGRAQCPIFADSHVRLPNTLAEWPGSQQAA